MGGHFSLFLLINSSARGSLKDSILQISIDCQHDIEVPHHPSFAHHIDSTNLSMSPPILMGFHWEDKPVPT